MPAEKLDPRGNADILVFKEIIKMDDFSRLGQTGSMIKSATFWDHILEAGKLDVTDGTEIFWNGRN